MGVMAIMNVCLGVCLANALPMIVDTHYTHYTKRPKQHVLHQ